MAARRTWPHGVCLTILVCIAAVAVAGEQRVPFSAPVRVVADHSYLRAGPGDDYYPTERLTAGATLEAWAVNASGYVAVRPIEGSYSWLRACDIDDAADNTAENAAEATRPAGGRRCGVIVTDGAVSRVGSQLNDLRHVAQVSLEAGKRVHVIEEVRTDAGRQAGLWVRIEPPAGEFRWARLADLETPPGFVPPAIRETLSAATVPQGTASLGGAVATIKAASMAVALALRAEPQPVAVSSDDAAVSGDELADIDLALSLSVTGPADDWNLSPVRERLRRVAAYATTATDQTRVEAIDFRIARFETIQSRHRALAAAPSPAAEPIRIGVLPGGQPADGQPTRTPPDLTETSGRLATVVSRRPNAPRWAIVDQSNNVIAFITPQAGVNLAPLVGQDVAVRGARGYMPEYKRPFVVAVEARVRMASELEASPDRAKR